MNEEQYKVVCARRQGFDALVWQVPSLAIAAQSFLLTTVVDPDTSSGIALGLALLSVTLGFGAYQLMRKHRQLELEDSERLVRFETSPENLAKGYEQIHGGIGLEGIRRDTITSWSSVKIWSGILLLFVVAGIIASGFAFDKVLRPEAETPEERATLADILDPTLPDGEFNPREVPS